MSQYGLGLIRDTADQRDLAFTSIFHKDQLPEAIDLRTCGHLPPVYDQGQLGSCTANGLAAAVDFDNHKEGEPWVNPSRLFIYYNERLLEGTVSADSGAQIRDGVKVLNKYGVCPESEWPYDVDQYTVAPPQSCYTDGLTDRALAYKRVDQDEHDLKSALAQGFPVVVGITVYESMMSPDVAASGVVPMPEMWEQPAGGHCILLVGYNADGTWLLRNSWGTSWGQQGYFTLPSDYLTTPGLGNDYWVVSRTGK